MVVPFLFATLVLILVLRFGELVIDLPKTKPEPKSVPETILLPHWEWMKVLDDTINNLTLETIDDFVPHSIPTTRLELKKFQRPQLKVINYSRPKAESTPPVCLYKKYETESYDIHSDQLAVPIRTYTTERGIGEPIAVRVGPPVFDPNILSEFTVWKCTTHDNVRIKFNTPAHGPLVHSEIAKQFECPNCEAEKRDSSLALKRMGVIELDKINVGNQIITSNGVFYEDDITRDDL